jgi:hypothetical protein
VEGHSARQMIFTDLNQERHCDFYQVTGPRLLADQRHHPTIKAFDADSMIF